ncbi:MAG: ABC transporter ATP-binding protein [Pseudotabrizicola sp.]|uniref:ABC transporter ATP-binding protein n=1 Tax=Pseudotabrizicola sp. TaxID=2939647 RepID=UPI00272558B0|nr:ABC transporter ATP-binding protein [Pseudotabrizicola sp.]MDO8884708.1 ABC transporter ATP-binding protein [Pseudotabrizicola sp.]MDP2082558.1 ABC transporter ATP-binding protein [Pseudotabrizicola sp.]MDZ7573931.1 ABC transporter ATP-binding protein [Pseudotabrizicola sp.]
MTVLMLDRLTARRGPCEVLEHISLSVGAGECVGLIGPNGAGKTTLMRAALGLMPIEGTSSLASLSPIARAATAAWLPQSPEIAWPVTVSHLVALGAMARGRSLDHPTVDHALDRMGLAAFRNRAANGLSGGEQARVLIARALAQDTPLLLADEPIAGLDPAQQIRTMRVFRDLAREGRSVIVSLHDLGLAARHCTRIIVVHAGAIAADGPAEAVLTDTLMAKVFGVTSYRAETAAGPVFQPMDTVGP